MNNENNSTANFTKAMKTDNIARIAVTFLCAIVSIIFMVFFLWLYLQGGTASGTSKVSLDSLMGIWTLMLVSMMIGSIPLGYVILHPGFPKYSTKSLRIRFFRGLNKFVLILGCIPVIGWFGWIMVIIMAYIGIPVMFGMVAGPVYMVIFLIRFFQKKPLIFNYEIPKYSEEPPIDTVNS